MAAETEHPTALAPLLAQARACTHCADQLPLGPKPLLQAGATARVLIVGQAPGRRTHLAGVPFQDASGKRLRQWLGVDEATFYDPGRFAILPMAFCYPGTGPQGDLPPPFACAPLWHPKLLAELPQVRLAVLLGRYAVQRYGNGPASSTLTEHVARYPAYLAQGRVVLPHPSPRNQRWLAQNPWYQQDALPALRLAVAQALA